jgi:hypothetical protein
VLGGGKYEPIPGTGIWKDVVDSVSCRGYRMKAITTRSVFNLGMRHPSECFSGRATSNHPDSKRHVEPAQSVAVVLFGYRFIEPQSASVVLKKDDHIQSVEFELVQRPRPWRTILSAAIAGAIVGSALHEEIRLRRYLIR